MKSNKKNILEKIVKKDYSNKLEKILEEKQFSEEAKSILLSIIYKIEAAYKDIEAVKKDTETKEEYIENILKIINKKCNSIKIIKMSNNNTEIPKNKTYIINKEKKEILSYPIERKLLYAICKISKKDNIIKDEYFLVNETMSSLINAGNNINMVEPLRDFNGYSWTTLSREIESIDHNLIYQNLRLLLSEKFLVKWINNKEFIIDYYYVFKEKLESQYGKKLKDKLVQEIEFLSILLEVKFDQEKEEVFKKNKEELEKKIQEVKDNKQFIKKITDEKIKINEEIKEIDTIINDKHFLEEEYKKRNEKLPLDKKIFSMKILSKQLNDEREVLIKKLEELNQLIKPKNFLKYKKELDYKYKYLQILDIEDKEKEINRKKLSIQELFIKAFEKKIEKAQTKQEMEKIIYDLRYYEMLQYDKELMIKDKKELSKDIQKLEEKTVIKSISLNVLEKISNDEKTNYEIFKNIFKVRIIKLEDSYLQITKENNKYFIQIFDENIFEEKVEISEPEELEIKLNKKVAIWK